MKANAKKLLALILAMVMSLSLAAPAMAAGGSVLKTQALVTATATDTNSGVWSLEYNDVSGSFTIATGTDVVAAGNVKDKTQANSNVKVTLKTTDPGLIGSPSVVPTYDVEYTVGANNTVTFTGVKVGTASTPKTLNDVTTWRTLSGNETVILVDGDGKTPATDKYGQVKGSVYEEKMSSGAVNAYFKLYDGNSDNTDYTNDELTFVAKNVAALGSDSDVQNALQKARKCNDKGEIPDTAATIVKEKAYKKVDSEATATVTYSFTAMNMNGVKINGVTTTQTVEKLSEQTYAIDKSKDAANTTGTFQLSIYNKTGTDNKKWYYVTSKTEAEDIIAKQFKDIKTVSVESVTGPEGNYWTVSVKEVEGAAPIKANKYSKNVMVVDGTSTAVLMNDAKDGFYIGGDDKGANGKSISAGKVATGPVAVRWIDVNSAAKGEATLKKLNDPTTKVKAYKDTKEVTRGTLDANNFDTLVFDSLDDAKGKFVVSSCKEGTTVPYAQLKLNGVIGGHRNELVTVTVTNKFGVATATLDTLDELYTAANKVTHNDNYIEYSVKPNDYWFQNAYTSNNASFVEKGTLTIEAAKHGAIVEREDVTTPATCETPGSKTTTKSCSICGAVIGTPVVAEIPKVTDPVEENTAKDPTDNTKKKMIFDSDDLKVGSRTAPKTKHYLTKAVPTTTVSEDKMTTTTTVDYYCNFGVKHPEKTQTWSVNKTELQHSGRWNSISMEKATEMEVINAGGGLFALVKNLVIADSDIENANVIMNRDTSSVHDTVIKVNMKNFQDSSDWTYSNGVYTLVTDEKYVKHESQLTGADNGACGIDVYATATGVATTKQYVAVVKVSDIVEPKYKHAASSTTPLYCDDGSFTVSATVYEVKDTAKGLNTAKTNYYDTVKGTNLTDNLKDGKVVVVNDKFSEKVTLTGTGHKYFNDDGVATELCTYCGTKKDSETPVANVIDAANVTVKDLTYTGKVAQPTVIVKDADGFTLIQGTDYVVSEVTDTAVGEYTITIKGINEYAGNKFQKTFKIVKAAAKKQTIKTTAKNKTYKAANLKKKAASFNIKVTGAKGTLTWKTSNKKIATVKSTAKNKAKVTAVKKAKKGTAKITVKAAKTSAYKASNTLTIKVIVK